MASLIEKQVNSLIEETSRVTGIRHVFVSSRQGLVLGAWSGVKTESILFDRVGMHLAKLIAAMQKRDGRPVEIESQYQHGSMLVRDLENAFAVFIYASTMNPSLFRMTLNVAATRFIQDAHLQKELAQWTRFSDALQVMEMFTNELIAEFGGNGIGSSKLVELLTPRMTKLKAAYPCLEKVKISHRGIDLSLLIHEEIPQKEIVVGWGHLVFAICASAIGDLGESAVAKRYRGIGIKVLKQDKKIFDDMGLTSVIPKLEGPVSFGG
jgi:predicted regulator of Ras-like GTPase activity (Roadblock/LC7/MglB family)